MIYELYKFLIKKRVFGGGSKGGTGDYKGVTIINK